MKIKTRVLIAWVGQDSQGRKMEGDYSVSTDAEYPFNDKVIKELKKRMCEFFDMEKVSILNIIPLSLEDDEEATMQEDEREIVENLIMNKRKLGILGEIKIREAISLIKRKNEENEELQRQNSELEIELTAMRGAANSYKSAVERLEKFLDDKCNRCIKRTKFDAYREFMDKLVTKVKNALPTIKLKWEIDRALREAYAELTEKGGTSE